MKRKFLIVMVMVMIISVTIPMISQATYQVRPNFSALKSVTAENFFKNIRGMETSDGPMGLDMPKNDTNIYQGYGANNIDVHMMKNTEWGAVAMLALSGYGVGNQAGMSGTNTYTTGNCTGVCNMGDDNWEYMATLTSKSSSIYTTSTYVSNNLKNANSKYYDLYSVDGMADNNYRDYERFYSNNQNKKGDAIYETIGIYLNSDPSGSRNHVCASAPFFLRGHSSNGGVLASNDSGGNAYSSFASRAVVVCGAGL